MCTHACECVSAGGPQSCVPQADKINVRHTPCSPSASLQKEHSTLRKSDPPEPGPPLGSLPRAEQESRRRGGSAHSLSPRPPAVGAAGGRWRGPVRSTVQTLKGVARAGRTEVGRVPEPCQRRPSSPSTAAVGVLFLIKKGRFKGLFPGFQVTEIIQRSYKSSNIANNVKSL